MEPAIYVPREGDNESFKEMLGRAAIYGVVSVEPVAHREWFAILDEAPRYPEPEILISRLWPRLRDFADLYLCGARWATLNEVLFHVHEADLLHAFHNRMSPALRHAADHIAAGTKPGTKSGRAAQKQLNQIGGRRKMQDLCRDVTTWARVHLVYFDDLDAALRSRDFVGMDKPALSRAVRPVYDALGAPLKRGPKGRSEAAIRTSH